MGLLDIWAFSIYNPVANSIFDAIIIIVIVYIIFLYIDYIKNNNNHKVSLIIFLIYFVVHIAAMFDFMYIIFSSLYFLALIVVFIISIIIELVCKHKRTSNEKAKTLKNNIVTGVLTILIIVLGLMLLNRQALYNGIINYQMERENKEYEQKKENIQNKIDQLFNDKKYEELIDYCKENNRKDDLKKAYEFLCKKYIREEKYEDAYNVYYESVIVNKDANFKIDDEFTIEQRIKYIKDGDSILFGGIGMTKYGLDVGKFPIKWYLLKREDGKKYFISNFILLPKEFDEKGNSSFEKSSIRKFLNKYFYENAFNDSEKEKMCTNDNGDMIFLANEDDLSEKKLDFINTAYSEELITPSDNKYSLDLSKSTAYSQELITPNVFWICGTDENSTENVAKTYNSKTKSTSIEDVKNFKVGVVPVICLK